MPEYYNKEEIKKRHHEIIWPTVRIRAKDAWGSGTVVYSKADEKGKVHTFVITCHHVIEANIKVEKLWDQRVGMEVKRETRTPVEVQFFYYEHLSYAKGLAGSHRANIRCYDERQDIALLELEKYEKPVDWVSNVFPPDNVLDIHVFDPVYACGAAMAHQPITTKGTITCMNDIIDDYDYWMSTAQIIFGNSGGAIFRYSKDRDMFEFIGIPARIAVNASGFSADAITHMGYFVPISRIYKHLKENFYDFIFDKTKTYEDSEKAREEQKEKDRQLYMARFGGRPTQGTGLESRRHPKNKE